MNGRTESRGSSPSRSNATGSRHTSWTSGTRWPRSTSTVDGSRCSRRTSHCTDSTPGSTGSIHGPRCPAGSSHIRCLSNSVVERQDTEGPAPASTSPVFRRPLPLRLRTPGPLGDGLGRPPRPEGLLTQAPPLTHRTGGRTVSPLRFRWEYRHLPPSDSRGTPAPGRVPRSLRGRTENPTGTEADAEGSQTETEGRRRRGHRYETHRMFL